MPCIGAGALVASAVPLGVQAAAFCDVPAAQQDLPDFSAPAAQQDFFAGAGAGVVVVCWAKAAWLIKAAKHITMRFFMF